MPKAVVSSKIVVASPTITQAEFDRLREMVYRHCGIHLKEGKQELVRARVARRLRTGAFPSLNAYLDFVVRDKTGREMTDLIDSISTNLTSFFRESGHFTFLREQFLPQLLERKRRAGCNTIRAWSAGCSTGEEPYSLAMLLHETVIALGGWDVKILATDVSRRVLRIARGGLYPENKIGRVPEHMRAKYFRRAQRESEEGFFVEPRIRQLIQFNYLNLMEKWPFSGQMDFIFCRNVMIYFDQPTQERLIQRFYTHLQDGGVLMTGHSESLSGMNHNYQYIQPTVYGKRVMVAPLATTPVATSLMQQGRAA
jgi:chemotaxis protein methyltransferase CheR